MVKLGCAASLIKGFIFCFNIICAAGGVVLVIHGSISLLKVKELRSYLQNSHLDDATLVPTIVICLGIFVFLISFFGATGACQESRILIETYAICMLSLILMQVILACLIFLFLDDINQDSVKNFNKIWRLKDSPDNQMMIEMIQENLECCGLNGASDYNFRNIPLTCCTKESQFCTFENAFKIGCKAQLRESIKSSGHMISLLCLITAGFELIASIFGFILSKQIRKCNGKRRCC